MENTLDPHAITYKIIIYYSFYITDTQSCFHLQHHRAEQNADLTQKLLSRAAIFMRALLPLPVKHGGTSNFKTHICHIIISVIEIKPQQCLQ